VGGIPFNLISLECFNFHFIWECKVIWMFFLGFLGVPFYFSFWGFILLAIYGVYFLSHFDLSSSNSNQGNCSKWLNCTTSCN
jgi:hypothetical protein